MYILVSFLSKELGKKITLPEWLGIFLILGGLGAFLFGIFSEGIFFDYGGIINFFIAFFLLVFSYLVWKKTVASLVSKLLFLPIVFATIGLCIWIVYYGLCSVYLKNSLPTHSQNECLTIVEFGDYEKRKPNIGEYFIVEYHGYKTQITLPPSASLKFNGVYPKCLNVTISKNQLDISFISDIKW